MKTILIVDDSPVIRRKLRSLFERREDWKVSGEAENGRDGIDQALRLSPDVIVLDLSMPVMNGSQAARELQRLLPGVPILMFTTFNNRHIEREALASDVTAVKSKSDGLESLCEVMDDLLKAA